MSGGGGGGNQTSTGTTYSSNLPEYAKPYYEELLKQTGKQVYKTDSSGKVTGVQDYDPYTGERLAGFTDQQKSLQSQIAALNPSPSGFATGAGNVGSATTLGLGVAGTGFDQAFRYAPKTYTPGAVTTGSFTDAGVADKYMDPYYQSVVDVQKKEAQRLADIQKNQAAMGSIGRGTFGSGREALMTGERDRNTQDLLNKIQAEGGTNAYNQALKAFEAEQARSLTAQTTNVQSGLEANKLSQQGQQYAAGLGKDVGLAGLSGALEGGKAQAGIASDQRVTELKTLLSQSTDAEEQQKLNQEIASLEYQKYKEEQDFEKQQLEYLSAILRGNAGALGSTQVQYSPAPSLASQIGGGVAGIAGLYGAMNQG
jgi:hypothetical protein